MRYIPRVSRGFTLIELLVVIAIIAILAAILFPVFARAREKSRQTKCMNNQRQIAVAIQMYTQDNNESYFPVPKTGPYAALLANYNEPSIYDCPTLTGTGTNNAPEYIMNAEICGKPVAQLARPSQTVVTADIKKSAMTGSYTFRQTAINASLDARHGNGIILSMADGSMTFVNVKTDAEAALSTAKLTMVPDPVGAKIGFTKSGSIYVAPDYGNGVWWSFGTGAAETQCVDGDIGATTNNFVNAGTFGFKTLAPAVVPTRVTLMARRLSPDVTPTRWTGATVKVLARATTATGNTGWETLGTFTTGFPTQNWQWVAFDVYCYKPYTDIAFSTSGNNCDVTEAEIWVYTPQP